VLPWFLLAFVGRLLIYTWMQFPLPQVLEKRTFFKKLHECDFCAGVWSYSILSYVMQLSLLEDFGFSYFPFVSELVTGVFVSFLVHLLVLGWKTKFEVIVV
jgi:hypothetical protein